MFILLAVLAQLTLSPAWARVEVRACAGTVCSAHGHRQAAEYPAHCSVTADPATADAGAHYPPTVDPAMADAGAQSSGCGVCAEQSCFQTIFSVYVASLCAFPSPLLSSPYPPPPPQAESFVSRCPEPFFRPPISMPAYRV
ncbi:MAG: hypothetical protein LBM00_05830 [Deltaproteobacteria bacterium]|nr:hypothetical protein [Deltaproteobacteria bacterium]